MKTKIFKLTALIQLILGLLWSADFFFDPFWKEEKVLVIKSIHPNEFYWSFAFLIILFAIGFVIAVVVALVLRLIFGTTEASLDSTIILKEARSSTYWQFTFFTSFIFSLGLFLFGFYIKTTQSAILLYNKDEIVPYYFGTILSALIFSFIIGLLLLSTHVLWKTNKPSAVVMALLAFVFFSIPFLLGNSFNSVCGYQNYYHSEDGTGVVKDASTTQVVTTDSDYDQVNEEEEESQRFSIERLWENSEVNIASLDNTVKQFIYYVFQYDSDNLRFARSSYGGFINDDFQLMINNDKVKADNYEKGKINSRHVYNTLYNDNDRILAVFERYNHLLFDLVSNKEFKKNNMDLFTNVLLMSYNDLDLFNPNNQKLKEMYEIMDKGPDYFKDDYYYEKIKPYVSENLLKKYEAITFSDGSKMNEQDIVWAYSFWARRHSQGNLDAAHTILVAISIYYKN